MAKYIIKVPAISVEIDVDDFSDIGKTALPKLQESFENSLVSIYGKNGDVPLAGWFKVKNVK